MAVEVVKSAQVKSVQIYQNTHGQKQGQALDSQTSLTLHSEAGATDLLYQLLSYAFFLKGMKNPINP